jgi:hypothetical protein
VNDPTEIQVVPEPSTMALAAIGAALLFCRTILRRKTA